MKGCDIGILAGQKFKMRLTFLFCLRTEVACQQK